MKLSSTSFENNDQIPKKFGYKNENLSPPLTISGVPNQTKSLVLIMDDPDALDAVGKVWVHWVLWNISAETKNFPENNIPPNSVEGKNDFGEVGYGGPAPPDKEHLYIFKLYAINKVLDEPRGSTKSEIENSIKSSIIAEARLTGRFSPQ